MSCRRGVTAPTATIESNELEYICTLYTVCCTSVHCLGTRCHCCQVSQKFLCEFEEKKFSKIRKKLCLVLLIVLKGFGRRKYFIRRPNLQHKNSVSVQSVYEKTKNSLKCFPALFLPLLAKVRVHTVTKISWPKDLFVATVELFWRISATWQQWNWLFVYFSNFLICTLCPSSVGKDDFRFRETNNNHRWALGTYSTKTKGLAVFRLC